MKIVRGKSATSKGDRRKRRPFSLTVFLFETILTKL